MGGLQVRNSAGEWVPETPLEGSFVINIGDMLQRWSNDQFRSTVHRVVNREGRERFSIPFFFEPNFDTVVEVLPQCVSAARPARYACTLTSGDHEGTRRGRQL